MKTHTFTRTVVATCLALTLHSQPTHAGGPKLRDIPDFRQGVPKEIDEKWCTVLGSTGAFGWIHADLTYRSSDGVRQILVTRIADKSPASGLLEVHDIIMGASAGSKAAAFSKNARTELSRALAIAEEAKFKGKLSLLIWRKGQTKQVTLTIPVRGAYDPADPFGCEKTVTTTRILTDYLLKRGLRDGIDDCVDGLGLLATGEEEYLPMLSDFAHRLAKSVLSHNDGKGPTVFDRHGNALTGKTWHLAYLNLFLTEYHLATGDKEVLPAIKALSQLIAMGRSGVGTWSHGLAHPWENNGKLYGAPTSYGAMNQPGITLTVGLILAQKCGIDSPEIQSAIRKASDHLRFYADKGAIPYGDHEPFMAHEDNGKNSHAAVLFNLLKEPEPARYFARSTLASANEGLREFGHTGHFWQHIWGIPGAACGGEKAAVAMLNQMEPIHQLELRHDGSCIYQPATNCGSEHVKYLDWSTAGIRLLHASLPLRKLYITGRDGYVAEPISGEELARTIQVGSKEFLMSIPSADTPTLLEYLASWSPIVREKAAMALSSKEDRAIPRLISMLGGPDRHARYGAALALGFAGGDSPEAVDALIEKGLKSDDPTLQYFAIMSFAAPDSLPNRLQGPAVKERATPFLLQMVVDCDPERETATKLQFALSNALFFDKRGKTALCSGKEGIASADRKVLTPAIRAILATENGKARATVSNELPLLDPQDRELLSGDIYQSGKVRAPSGVMFGDDSRFAAVQMMVDLGYEEGIELGMALMREDRKWGRERRVMRTIPMLEPYGSALKPHMTEILGYFETYAEWCRNHNRASEVVPAEEALKRIKAAIADGEPAPTLRHMSSKTQ